MDCMHDTFDKIGLSLSMIRILANRLSLPLSIHVQHDASPKVYGKNKALVNADDPKAIYRKKRKAR